MLCRAKHAEHLRSYCAVYPVPAALPPAARAALRSSMEQHPKQHAERTAIAAEPPGSWEVRIYQDPLHSVEPLQRPDLIGTMITRHLRAGQEISPEQRGAAFDHYRVFFGQLGALPCCACRASSAVFHCSYGPGGTSACGPCCFAIFDGSALMAPCRTHSHLISHQSGPGEVHYESASPS